MIDNINVNPTPEEQRANRIATDKLSIIDVTDKNNQLKESNYNFTITNEKLRDELQEKYLEIEMLKNSKDELQQSHDNYVKVVWNEHMNIQQLKEKLSKINQLVESSEYPPSREQFQAILKGKE